MLATALPSEVQGRKERPHKMGGKEEERGKENPSSPLHNAIRNAAASPVVKRKKRQGLKRGGRGGGALNNSP